MLDVKLGSVVKRLNRTNIEAGKARPNINVIVSVIIYVIYCYLQQFSSIFCHVSIVILHIINQRNHKAASSFSNRRI